MTQGQVIKIVRELLETPEHSREHERVQTYGTELLNGLKNGSLTITNT
jgi:hypothetical protein